MQGKASWWPVIHSILLLTPLQLIFFIFVDIFFSVVSIIVTPLFFLISLCVEDSWIIRSIEAKLNSMFSTLFGLQKTDVEGFRRLRTSCQFSFESVPQVIFQVYLVWKLKEIE